MLRKQPNDVSRVDNQATTTKKTQSSRNLLIKRIIIVITIFFRFFGTMLNLNASDSHLFADLYGAACELHTHIFGPNQKASIDQAEKLCVTIHTKIR